MRKTIVPTIAAMLFAAGCGGTSAPEGTAPVTLQLATSSRGGPAAVAQIALGPDVLVIEAVQIVARKVRLAQVAGSCAEEPPAEGAEPAECPLLKLGPVLLEPPVVDGAVAAFSADLPAGSYDRLQMQIHKPTGSADRDFLDQYSDLDGISIRVTGTFNDAPFTFTTGLTVVQEIPLETPLEVVDGTPVEVTLLLDVAAWFLAPAGSSLLDPTALDQQSRSRIEQNIRQSFKAFPDANQDALTD